ncbi:hypothetical protein [Bradyrhizobium japonicum]|uniref:hypothetical protein n=1 Tax=Bradyrhizobium japonicum TaxID=375 RepID=UPI00126A749A|nr:hypothetical protein [Bradyrhizobium japonicum]
MTIQDLASKIHSSERPVGRILVDCCSPRGFTQDNKPEGSLNTFFVAARWASSAFDSRRWRFLDAFRGLSEFEVFLAPLIGLNQSWARHGGADLSAVEEGSPQLGRPRGNSRADFFDGAVACFTLRIQATSAGWTARREWI